jgi:hypothetical protein
MDLTYLRNVIRWKPARRSDKSGPQPPVNERDLALDQATHKDFVAVADGSSHGEDLVTFRMRPPAPPNGDSSDGLGKRRHRPLRSLEYHTVVTNERESLA